MHLKDEYEYEDEMDEEDYDEEFDPWVFIRGLPPLGRMRARDRAAILPRKSAVHYNKNTLVLDLDETLVHSNLEQTLAEADFSFPVNFNNQQHIVNVRKRRAPDGVHGVRRRGTSRWWCSPRRRRCTRSDC